MNEKIDENMGPPPLALLFDFSVYHKIGTKLESNSPNYTPSLGLFAQIADENTGRISEGKQVISFTTQQIMDKVKQEPWADRFEDPIFKNSAAETITMLEVQENGTDGELENLLYAANDKDGELTWNIYIVAVGSRKTRLENMVENHDYPVQVVDPEEAADILENSAIDLRI